MQRFPSEPSVLEKLKVWGRTQSAVRALILTSSRARNDGVADVLSDYDLVLAVTDLGRFEKEDAWISDYGRPIVRWDDQSTLYGLTTLFRGIIYEDYVKIDYSVWPDTMLDRISAEPQLPDCLDVLVFAKFSLDYQIKLEVMRRVLEWHIEIEHDWRTRPGVHGRNISRLLPPDLWERWSGTYVGSELEENWVALFRSVELFRRVATEVGAALGYTYPTKLDDEVTDYLKALRSLPAETRDALGAPRP